MQSERKFYIQFNFDFDFYRVLGFPGGTFVTGIIREINSLGRARVVRNVCTMPISNVISIACVAAKDERFLRRDEPSVYLRSLPKVFRVPRSASMGNN